MAEKVWTLISYASVVGSIFILFKSVKRKVSWALFMVIYGLFMISFPVKFTLGMGQVNLLLLLLISLSFYYYRKGQQYVSGIFLAVAVSIKLSPAVLLLFYVRKKQWRVVFGCMMIFVLLNLLSVRWLGLQATKDYWMGVFPGIPTVGNMSYYNQALTGWLSRALVPGLVGRAVNYLVFGGLLFLSVSMTKIIRKRPEIELGEYGLFVIATLIGAGLAWQHHFVVTLIPFMALGFIIFQKKAKRGFVWTTLISLSYLLIALNIKTPLSFSGLGGKLLLSHVFYGVLLLYGLLVSSLKLKARKTGS